MKKDITITIKNAKFSDDFSPPKYFDNNCSDNCKGCQFLFPGEDWVPFFCQLNIKDYHTRHICPLYEQGIFK